MTCDERQDLIPFYAAGTLPATEQEALRRHLADGCPVCGAALAEAQSLASLLAMSLEPVAPPPRVWERISKRVANDVRAPEPPPLRISPAARGSRWADWSRAILGGAAAAVAVFFLLDRLPRQGASPVERRVAQLESQLTEMQSTRKRTEQQITLPRSPAVQLVTLQGTPDAPGAKADLYWDHARGVWYLYTTGLPAPAAGRAYELWFIAGNTKTRAGVFDVTGQGEGSLVAEVPPGVGTISLAAVTDEPAGGSVQPTGKIRLAGAVTR